MTPTPRTPPLRPPTRATLLALVFLSGVVGVAAWHRDHVYPPPVELGQSLGFRIDLDTADVSQVTLLPGLGPAKAQALLDHHRQSPIREPADLQAVSGIGEKLARRIEPWVQFAHTP